MLGNMISNMMVKPHQSPLFDHPDNHDLDYEDVAFKAQDGTVLRGWLIAGGADKVIVQSHFGVQCNRGGWTPKGHGPITPWKQDIKFLRQAKYLSQQGYSVLMYDLRGHGESDLGPTPWVSWGPNEGQDVTAAVDFATDRFPKASIGLLSICMGAAATTYAFGQEGGLEDRKNVKAMIAVQPLLYTCFIEVLGMPGFVARAGERVSQKRLGFDMAAPNFIDHAPRITIPTLVAQNQNDPWTQMGMVEQYFDALGGEKELRMLDIDKSRFAAYDYIGSHPQELMGWFDQHV